MPTRLSLLDDLQLGLEKADPPPAVVHLGRDRLLTDGHPRAGGVEQADGLVRQLPGRYVAVREFDRGFQGFVENLDPVVGLHDRGHAAHHQDGLFLAGFLNLDHLKPAREGRILFDILLVFPPGGSGDGPQGAARQGRLQEVGGIAGSGRPAGTDQGVGLVDKEDDRLFRCLDLVDHLAQTLLEFPLVAGPCLQQSHVQHPQDHILQRRRHVTGRNAQGEPFHHRGLADTGFTGQDGIVLPPAHENVDDLPDLFIPRDNRIDPALPRPFGEVDGEPAQGFLFAERRRCESPFGGRSLFTAQLGSIRGRQVFFR